MSITASYRKHNIHQKAIWLLSAITFLLIGMPKLGIKFGSLPIYAIDILIVSCAYYAQKIKPRYSIKTNMSSIVTVILIIVTLSELSAAIQLGEFLKPIYIIMRTLIAGSLFFSISKIIQTPNDLESILKAALFGALITAILLIITSLPFTKSIAQSYVFSIPYLDPNGANVALKLDKSLSATRGTSLVGVSILSGAFLNTIWALLLYLMTNVNLETRWKNLLKAVSFIIPFAVVMTYSRGAILGLIMVTCGVIFFNSSKSRRIIVAVIGLAVIVFAQVGWDSEYFFFDRVINRTQAMIQNPYEDKRESERIYAYTEPFEHLVENPLFLFIGEGFARRKVGGNELTAGNDAATHAVFAAAYYAYGMMAALAYMYLLFKAFQTTWKYAHEKANKYSNRFSQALLASLLGFIPWFILGHAAVSQPRGAMLMFFVFGLVALQPKFQYFDRMRNQTSKKKELPLVVDQ
ncbi:MAG: hypothetical protein ACJASM_002168 [Salibacteraceae bacterium]|jgi:hypothetical protein